MEKNMEHEIVTGINRCLCRLRFPKISDALFGSPYYED